MDMGLLGLPRFRGASHADDHDNRFGYRGAGQVVIRRQLKRRSVLVFFQKLPPCLVGMEACGSSHHWSSELQALGHAVRLMPPAYVALTQACTIGSAHGSSGPITGHRHVIESLHP